MILKKPKAISIQKLKLQLLPHYGLFTPKKEYFEELMNILRQDKGRSKTLHEILLKSRLTKTQTKVALRGLLESNKITGHYSNEGKIVFALSSN